MTLLMGDRVRLRPLEPDDMKDVFIGVNNPEAVGDFDVFHVTSWCEVEKWFKELGGLMSFQRLLFKRMRMVRR